MRGWEPGDTLGEEKMLATPGMRLYVMLVSKGDGWSVDGSYGLVRRNGWVYSGDGKYAAPESSIVKVTEGR